jgi:hypothetical protein
VAIIISLYNVYSHSWIICEWEKINLTTAVVAATVASLESRKHGNKAKENQQKRIILKGCSLHIHNNMKNKIKIVIK